MVAEQDHSAAFRALSVIALARVDFLTSDESKFDAVLAVDIF